MSNKKLVTIEGGQSVHRSCRPPTGSKSPFSAAAPVRAKKQKPMSRDELLRRIAVLRERDAQNADVAAKGRSGTRRRPKSQRSHPSAGPQPYYGVEMKRIAGQWVQMHPESE
ncbi:hypothetical protein [Streptomyces platensis]|uniref:hypothetical protein n=1 Tax=Streptomyces platensis TaxID=58346 RepID=UPI0037AC9D76